MKKKTRSIPGKVLLHLGVILSLLVFCLSLAGNALIDVSGYDFSSKDKEELYHSIMLVNIENTFMEKGCFAIKPHYEVFFDEKSGREETRFVPGKILEDFGSMEFVIKDEYQKVIAETEGAAKNKNAWEYVFLTTAFCDKNGKFFLSDKQSSFSAYPNLDYEKCYVYVSLKKGGLHWDALKIRSLVARTMLRFAPLRQVIPAFSFFVFVLCSAALVRLAVRRTETEENYHLLDFLWQVLCLCGKGIFGLRKLLVRFFFSIPLFFRTAAVGFFLLGIDLLLLHGMGSAGASKLWFFLFLAEKIVVIAVVCYAAVQLRKLQKGARRLAEGNLEDKILLQGMVGDFRESGEYLNSIAHGMAVAVEERVKSERMKTELITNVSHDIKTPLTSIINYSSLLTDCADQPEKASAYAEVLKRQSVRLKRLLEDLVEASKATSGTLEVTLESCDAAVFLEQASGEYAERLEKYQLTLVTEGPEKELYILADGRRMWRIFDNLFSNICKYSMPGTRVYLTLTEEENRAVFTFKNISREGLNRSEDELMERFIRGDRSRNTEGNGLGLAIAKSLAELQNGQLNIQIDGDLFKAVLRFPVSAGGILNEGEKE